MTKEESLKLSLITVGDAHSNFSITENKKNVDLKNEN